MAPSRFADPALAKELVAAEARERRKVAELLHDDVLQLLAAARMALAVNEAPEEVDALIRQAVQRSREICRGLEPIPMSSRLEDSIPHVITSVRQSHGLHTRLEADSWPVLHQTAHDVMVSSLGELLANVAKHAPGSVARVALATTDHWVYARVDDDGPGFGTSSDARSVPSLRGGMGLPMLQRRLHALGGDMDWWTRTPRGASVMLLFPR